MKKELTKTYHIIFDAIEVDPDMLDKEWFVIDCLLTIPGLIDMKIMSGPHVARDYAEYNKGVSGFAIINYSHISIHTFPLTKEIYVDIFSCRPFDFEKVRRYLYEKLGVGPENVETFEVKYPWE